MPLAIFNLREQNSHTDLSLKVETRFVSRPALPCCLPCLCCENKRCRRARHSGEWSTLGLHVCGGGRCREASPPPRNLSLRSARWPWHSQLAVHSLCPTPTLAARPENEPSSVQQQQQRPRSKAKPVRRCERATG